MAILTPGIDRKFQITDEYKLEEKQSLRFYPLKKDFAVCLSTIGDEKRLTFVNAKGRIIKKMGDYPPILNNTKVKGDNNIFQANMTGTPDGSMILIACSQTDVLEIYNTEKGLMKRFQGPIGIQLSVKDTGVGKLLDPSYKTFSYSKANENEFWVSYVGYNFTAGKKPSSSNGTPKQIYCFDWNGKPLRIIKFDSCFHGFDVDWNSKIMYLLEDGNEGTEIVSYSLIDILK